MKILRTPDSRFENLEGYPFAAHYVNVGDEIRMHYLDEGEPENPVILLFHGEPSWSYLYRKMIPIFVKNNYRVLVPDLIGFGKSDKPTETTDYTFAKHLEWLGSWMDQMNLTSCKLFCQDWGGLLGLRLLAKTPTLFDQLIVANTILPNGLQPMSEPFEKWKKYSQTVPEFPVAGVIDKATVSTLSEEVLHAYNAPFPDESYKAGARIFPSLVPASPDDPESANNIAAWQVLAQFQKPVLTLFSDSDPIMKGLEKVFQKIIPGAKHDEHEIIEAAGHFLQEDKGEEIAEKVVAWLSKLV